VKVGDLVRRYDTFKEWLKYNAWMTLDEEKELGIITKFDEGHAVVLWSTTGLSWEDEEDIEVVGAYR
jgi:hypothetical protein